MDQETRKAIILVNHALDLVLSKALEHGGSLTLKGNKFFVTGGHAPLGASLCTMRGYHFSIRPGMCQILLAVDTSTSAFFNPIPVIDFLIDENTFRAKSERLAMLQGLKVKLAYNPTVKGKESSKSSSTETSSIKTIIGEGLACNKQTFTLTGKDGANNKTTTVQEYFEQSKSCLRPAMIATLLDRDHSQETRSHLLIETAYMIRLKRPEVPAINCGTREMPLWYPAELLLILPYQLFKGKVPDSLTSGMHNVACRHPADTRALIEHEGLRMLCPNSATDFTPSVSLTSFYLS